MNDPIKHSIFCHYTAFVILDPIFTCEPLVWFSWGMVAESFNWLCVSKKYKFDRGAPEQTSPVSPWAGLVIGNWAAIFKTVSIGLYVKWFKRYRYFAISWWAVLEKIYSGTPVIKSLTSRCFMLRALKSV